MTVAIVPYRPDHADAWAALNESWLAEGGFAVEAKDRKVIDDPQGAILDPGGREAIVHGEVDGRILEAVRGTGGFGYDPIFFVAELGKTFAEMSLEEKRSVSHRGRALRKARRVLEEWYGFGSAE